MVGFAKGSPIFGNQNPPKIITGAMYWPSGYNGGSSMTTTATRCYYIPFPVFQASTFTSVATRNSAGTDNGEKYRVMAFADDGASGGPGTLAKDFGEVTLTAADAIRTLTPGTAWSPVPGMYWIALWFESATQMYGMTSFTQGAASSGFFSTPNMTSMIGSLSEILSLSSITACHYVDTAYGSAPATAVAPTATLIMALNSTTALVPAVMLKG